MTVDPVVQNDVRELVVLILLTDRFEAVMATGSVSPNDEARDFNSRCRNRLEQILTKYDVILPSISAL